MLDIQDYLDATSDASKRTRTVSFTLVVACVLVFAGLLNSMQNHWMLQRLHELSNPNGIYTQSKIGSPPKKPTDGDGVKYEEYKNQQDLYEQRHLSLFSSAARAYIENSLVIRVPLFGFTFDVNDLGLMGGMAFLVLLILLRFCLSREVDNLKWSFSEAHKLGQCYEFYTLLAMRQVLTVPPTHNISRGRFLLWAPKITYAAPLVLYGFVTLHDFQTAIYGKYLSSTHTLILLSIECLLLVGIFAITVMAITRLRRIDKIWSDWWNISQSNEDENNKANLITEYQVGTSIDVGSAEDDSANSRRDRQ